MSWPLLLTVTGLSDVIVAVCGRTRIGRAWRVTTVEHGDIAESDSWLSITTRSRADAMTLMSSDKTGTWLTSTWLTCCGEPSHMTCVLVALSRSQIYVHNAKEWLDCHETSLSWSIWGYRYCRWSRPNKTYHYYVYAVMLCMRLMFHRQSQQCRKSCFINDISIVTLDVVDNCNAFTPLIGSINYP